MLVEDKIGSSLYSILGWSYLNALPSTSSQDVTTHRQVLALKEYRQIALSIPNRDNFYQMLLACQITRTNAKTPQSIHPKDFYMKFDGNEPMTKDERNRIVKNTKAVWLARLGGSDRVTVMDLKGNIIKEASKTPIINPMANPLMRNPTPKERQEMIRNRKLSKRSSSDNR